MYKFISLFPVIFLLSCAGYRFQESQNPFSQYSIKSLSVPMFYNKSNLGNVTGLFTKKIFHTLTSFNDLDLLVGENPSADAVLLGIIESGDKKRDSLKTETSRFVSDSFGNEVLNEKRNDFVVPSSNRVSGYLRVIVIKHPTKEEIEFLQSDYGSMALSSKVIFNERIALSSVYNLKQHQGEAISVVGTQNQGVYNQSMEQLAEQAADNFRNMILYAF